MVSLPDTIGKLANLYTLDVRDNELSALPTNLRQLKNLRELYLHGNYALNIPPERLGGAPGGVSGNVPTSEILEYYFQTNALLKKPLNEAKLVFVGRGGVGKTSLRNMLTTGRCDKGEDKTPGIEVTPWDTTLASGEKIKLNVWDFGGQERRTPHISFS